ncbi:MAG TPA: DUF72 domain-containing protein [Devosia sp.]|nr:DUF72 domain-containing protein [Devosia sp.]
MSGTVRTGIAGWVFDEWRGGAFYPEGLKQKEELGYASRHLGAIEINATFYSHQKPASFESWAAQTPETFVFPVKGHQGITHIKRLKDVELPLANFFASGVLALGERLGPFVWQLPGNARYDPARMETFLKLLPKTPDDLLALAGRHDEKTANPYLDLTGIEQVRHAIEVRHTSFAEPAFIDMLRAHNVALVVADTAEWPTIDPTADFIYCRLQGAPGSDHYTEADLDAWAERIRLWASGQPMTSGPFITTAETGPKPRDVFAHFVSTDKKNAPKNAMRLAEKLG